MAESEYTESQLRSMKDANSRLELIYNDGYSPGITNDLEAYEQRREAIGKYHDSSIALPIFELGWKDGFKVFNQNYPQQYY